MLVCMCTAVRQWQSGRFLRQLVAFSDCLARGVPVWYVGEALLSLYSTAYMHVLAMYFFFFWKRQVTADFTIPATLSRPSKDRQEGRATRQTLPVRVGTTLPPHGYVGGTLQCNPAQSTGVQGPTMHPFCFYSTSLPTSSHDAGACTQEACQRNGLTRHTKHRHT